MSEDQGYVTGFRLGKDSFTRNSKSWKLSDDVEWSCHCGESGKGIESYMKHYEKITHPIIDFEREYLCDFIKIEPNDELWLDKKERACRTEYWQIVVICVYCKKEIKIHYDKRNNSVLEERIQGRICPNCNQGSLRLN